MFDALSVEGVAFLAPHSEPRDGNEPLGDTRRKPSETPTLLNHTSFLVHFAACRI